MKIFQITVLALFAYTVAAIAAQQIASKMVLTLDRMRLNNGGASVSAIKVLREGRHASWDAQSWQLRGSDSERFRKACGHFSDAGNPVVICE